MGYQKIFDIDVPGEDDRLEQALETLVTPEAETRAPQSSGDAALERGIGLAPEADDSTGGTELSVLQDGAPGPASLLEDAVEAESTGSGGIGSGGRTGLAAAAAGDPAVLSVGDHARLAANTFEAPTFSHGTGWTGGLADTGLADTGLADTGGIDWSAAEGGRDVAVGPAGTLDTLATYLNERNTGSGGSDFWDDFWGGGSDVSTPFWNLTNAGTNAQNGTISYNVTGNNFDANGIGSASRIDLIRHALNVYEDILGINFVETTAVDADLNFGDWDPGRAYANFNRAADGSISNSWINIAANWSGGSAIGDYYFSTALHEIGHVLGLGHQGNYNVGGGDTYADATWANDTRQFTMMSYWAQSNYTPSGESTPNSVNGIGPQAVDWLALDRIYNPQGYGIDDGSTTGNTTWGFNSSWVDWTPTSTGPLPGLANTAYASLDTLLDTNTAAIVDGGGIDTLDLSGFSNNTRINITITSGSSTAPAFSNVAGLVGNLSIAVGTVIENVVGGAGGETIIGNTVANVLDGGGGNDTIDGGGGVDTVYGGAGDDVIRHFDAGSDRYDGGTGTDTLEMTVGLASGVEIDLEAGLYRYGTFTLDWTNFENYARVGGSGGEAVYGTAGTNVIQAGDGDNVLDGRGGLDTVYGGAGDDVIRHFDAGGDRYDGGTGTDTLEMTVGLASGVEIDLEAGLYRYGTFTLDWTNFENYARVGGSGGEAIYGTVGTNVIRAGDGDNVLDGRGGDDVLAGGAGADQLIGGWGTDLADYSGSGAAVRVRLWNGLGDYGDAQGDTLSGIEDVRGSAQNDVLHGTNGDGNRLEGGDGHDLLRGYSGNDVLDGGAGSDRLEGGADDDVLTGGAGPDVLDGGWGTDLADYSGSGAAVRVRLWNGLGDFGDAQGDTLSGIEDVRGSAQNDVLHGANGVGNRLEGGGGHDVLRGYSGTDVLDGGAGSDLLDGGWGNDSFVFGAGYGRDRVLAFQDGLDVVDLTGGLGFGDLSLSAIGGGVRAAISATPGIWIDLMGVTLPDIDAGDFI